MQRTTLRLAALSWLGVTSAPLHAYGYADIFAPVSQHHFTAPGRVHVYMFANDLGAPDYWNPIRAELYLDGTLVFTTTEFLNANCDTTLTGLPAGTHVLKLRSYEHDGMVRDSLPVTVFVDPPRPDGPVTNMSADIVLAGSQNLDIVGSAALPAKVIGNGHQIRSADGWTGRLTIRNAELRGVGTNSLRALDVLANGAGQIVIEDSLFEESGIVQVGGDGTAQVALRRNTFSANMLMTEDELPFSSDPAVRLTGNSTATKFFQGNRVGIGWAEFAITRNWLVGGDTDADTNIVVAARGGIQVIESQNVVMRGNYSRCRYHGGWSQGLNFELFDSSGLLAEHNIVLGSSWPVRGLDGEFRYGVVIHPGHAWFQTPEANANIHHNVLINEGNSGTEQGLWVLYGNLNVRFANNTMDVGAPGSTWFGPGVTVSNGSAIVRSNAFTRFPTADANYPVVNNTDGDYNLFYNPETDEPRNYSSGGAGPHDAGGAVPNAQIDPRFAGPRPLPLFFDEGDVWERRLTVSQMLRFLRGVYTPGAGSPLTDHGDPAGDPGNDIGAVGSGLASPYDHFGYFGSSLPNAPNAPGVLQATGSASQVTLAWLDLSNSETGFRLERKTGVAGAFAQIASLGPNVTTFPDTTVAADTTYVYRVRAAGTSGDSAYSNEAVASTNPTLPNAPAGLAAAGSGYRQVHVTWTDLSGNETGFKLERKPRSTGAYAEIATLPPGSTSYDDTVPVGPRAFTYRVHAFNDAGDSGFAAEAVASVFTKGDLSQDLKTDLLLRRLTTGENRLWRMNGTTRSSETTISPAPPAGEQVFAVDDFDADQRNDLVFRNLASGDVRVWLMNGATRVGAPVTLTAPPLALNWKLAAVADFDRDERPDILWRDEASQLLAVWLMNGTTRTGNLTPTPDRAADANWEVVAALDWNGDSFVDLLWYNATSGRVVLWFMDQNVARLTGQFTNPMAAGDNNWRVLAAGDYGVGPDAQVGTADILWRNATSGRYVAWLMDRQGNRTAGMFTNPDAPTTPLEWTIVGPK